MKFTCTVIIKLPITKVLALWKDETNNKEWQDGFISKELIEGQKEEIGSKYKILLEQGSRKMELIETILINDLPKERKSLVEHVHMDNTQLVKFESISENETRYVSEIEYTSFKHFMPRILAKLFPNMFKKQVQKWLDQFKKFAESK
jgi:uncharacterized membrane protein